MKRIFNIIIFDLDGTLIDTMGAFADLAGELISHNYGWSFEQGRKRYLETSGLPFFQQLDLLFPGRTQNREVAHRFESQKVAVFVRESVSEKTLETLYTLKEREYRTAISSNNVHDLVKEFVHRENVPVDLALGYKPGATKGAQHFEHIRDYFKLPMEQMMFVGDSLNDAHMAEQNGVRFVAKIGTFSAQEFYRGLARETIAVISEIYEILEILKAA